MAKSGDPCPFVGCKGRLYTFSSKRVANSQVRRLACDTCGKSGGESVVPADTIRPRKV